MKLAEALQIVRSSTSTAAADVYAVFLACGMMPLHIQTYLHAHLANRLPNRSVQVETGLFGDLIGNLDRAARSQVQSAAVIIEWSDLDPRLGIRTLGGWNPHALPELVADAKAKLGRIQASLVDLASAKPVAVLLPALPLPPLSFTPTWLASPAELELKALLYASALELSSHPRIRIANPQFTDTRSALETRFDVAGEMWNGFPYRTAHADAIGHQLALLVAEATPKKGLITDLDDTFWGGLLGEAGIEGVSWDLDHKTHIHGIYQQFLHSLAASGVLIGIASKNDPAFVAQALERPDLLMSKEHVFPIEAGWGAKSEAVGRILQAWNIGADSVVFIDDTPMEVAEVQAAFPTMECAVFPKADAAAAYTLLTHLRDTFGKPSLQKEDALRLASIRTAQTLREQTHESSGGSLDDFLAQSNAELVLSETKDRNDPRPLELVNKTNQFNLNGRRYTESEWIARLAGESTFVLVASYQDKFGPLGKIAVLSGCVSNRTLEVDVWVMSCRAFSRRVEFKCLEYLLERYPAGQVILDYTRTERNGPAAEFIQQLTGSAPSGRCTIAAEQIKAHAPRLFHKVRVATHA